MKPSIHRDGNNAVLCRVQLKARQSKQPDFVNAVIAESLVNSDGDYIIPHKRMLELLKAPITLRTWPLLALPLRILAKPEDKGLGDIVARVVGPIGGEAFKAWYIQTFGKTCGCTKRQMALNELFPL